MPIPAAITNPVVQLGAQCIDMLDAERSDLITIATGVSSWAGVKGVLTVVQGTSGNQPSYSSTSFGGGASVNFDGINDYLEMTLAGQLPTGNDPGEIWILFNSVKTDNSQGYIVSYGDNTTGNWRAFQKFTGTAAGGTRGRVFLGGNLLLINGHPFTCRSVARMVAGGDSSKIFMDGKIEFSRGVTLTTVGGRLRLGSTPANTPTVFSQVQIAKVLFISGNLRPTTASSLWRYFMRQRRL